MIGKSPAPYEKQFLELLEDINLIAVCLDTEGKINFCNDSLLQLTGWQLEEVIGHTWFDRFVPANSAFIRHIHERNVNKGRFPRHFEYDILTRTGERRFISWNNTILRDAAGQAIGTANIGEDITVRKLAERELCAHQEQLKELVAELAFAEERERRRIAAELHDGVAQSLVFAKFKINDCLASSSDPGQIDCALSVRQTLDQSIEELRSLTFQLSPPLLYEVGFEAALEWLGEQFQEKHGFRVKIVHDGVPKQLAQDVAITLWQMVRELLINVAKHAAAKNVIVSLEESRNQLRITVTDDGKGMDPLLLAERGKMPAGFGLFNIRQRMQYIKGEMTLESQPESGTAISLFAPLSSVWSAQGHFVAATALQSPTPSV